MQEVTKINKEVEVALDCRLFLDKFNDVFHDKIIELPPVRKVGHAIDFVANAIPVSIAPYYLSLPQNEKLKNHLMCLLNKCYI